MSVVEACFDDKARQLRAFYRRASRDGPGERHYPKVRAEYERLFRRPGAGGGLEQILVNAWNEARELAGWTYDFEAQGWRSADGSAVLYDDGSEWRHL